MKKIRKTSITVSISLLLAFVIWTVLVGLCDVEAIGPNGTEVGFAAVNGAFHKLTGVNMTLYTITDWLGLVPIAVSLGFAVCGLSQWIKRKSITRVDRDIITLGIFYIAVAATYTLFELVVINYRPILIAGNLEASYPSSTTMLVACVMPSAMMQASRRIKKAPLRGVILIIISVFIAFTVIGRVLSGVHWLSDIIGGMLVSAGLVTAYLASITPKTNNDRK